MITTTQKELIAIETIAVLYHQIKEIGTVVNSHQIHIYTKTFFSTLFNEVSEDINFKSYLNGLNANLGQSFFEKTAHILSNSTKKEFKGNYISEAQKALVTEIITDLQNRSKGVKPNLQEENERIWSADFGNKVPANDFTADIFWEDEREVVAIEAKTVRPNSDVSKQTKTKILEAKCVLRNLYPDKIINYFYGFAFDPYGDNPTNSNKTEFMGKNVNFSKYFAEDEVLLASDFWDYLSGCDETMETILEIINSIATVEFEENFNFLQEKENAINNQSAYINLLMNWFLFREAKLVDKLEIVSVKIAGNKNLNRIFNQDVFVIKCVKGEYKAEYNKDRVSQLLQLLDE